jgi:hypothetical protein
MTGNDTSYANERILANDTMLDVTLTLDMLPVPDLAHGYPFLRPITTDGNISSDWEGPGGRKLLQGMHKINIRRGAAAVAATSSEAVPC